MAGVGRYRLVRTIASGGQACVYEAIASGANGFERRVAIKRVLPLHAGDESMSRMFLDEARIASRLHHGNIVQVLDYGIVDEGEFIVMEYVDGLTAAEAARRGRILDRELPPGIAAHILAEVAHAIAYLAELTDGSGRPLGIVHRDISPQNVLLSQEGDVKLADFGIAFALWREERTATGVIKGKFNYMAPEQALGRPVSSASDVFSLGATVYTLLTGEPLWPQDVPLADRLLSPLPEFSDSIPPSLVGLLQKCLARTPDARPDPREVAEIGGRLVTEFLSRDGRGALRGWMRMLQKESKPQVVSKLDDVLGLCLAPAPEGERQYTVSRISAFDETELPGPSGQQPADARLDATSASGSRGTRVQTLAPPEAVPAPLRNQGHRYGRFLPALLGIIGLVGLLVGVGPLFLSNGSESPPELVAAMPTENLETDRAIERGADEIETLPTAAEASAHDEEPAPNPPVARAAAARELRPQARRPVAESAGLEPTTAPSSSRGESSRESTVVVDQTPREGWIRIGGSSLSRHSILIDGSLRLSAPYEGRLPVGVHHIQISDPEGQVVLQRSVRIGPQHTRPEAYVITR